MIKYAPSCTNTVFSVENNFLKKNISKKKSNVYKNIIKNV